MEVEDGIERTGFSIEDSGEDVRFSWSDTDPLAYMHQSYGQVMDMIEKLYDILATRRDQIISERED